MSAKRYVIDLFCGIGGFSCGAELNPNCKVIACFDLWNKALAIHAHNVSKDCDHFLIELGGDVDTFVSQLNQYIVSKNILKETVHLHASPPCQSFSTLNTHIHNSIAEHDDEKTNLFYWTLEVVRKFNSPTWSLEQVPPALKHLKKKEHWILNEPYVKIYHRCLGINFGAPTLRARLYILKGISLDHCFTNKRKREPNSIFNTIYEGETTNPFISLSEELGHNDIAIKNETRTMKIPISPTDETNEYVGKCQGKRILYVKCQPNYGERINSIHEPGHALTGNSQSLFVKTADQTREKNALTIYQNTLQYFTERGLNIKRSKEDFISRCNVLPGLWKRIRFVNHQERLFIQGFPSSFDLDFKTITFTYYTDLSKIEEIQEIVKINSTDKIKAVGNSVIPLIAKEIINCI